MAEIFLINLPLVQVIVIFFTICVEGCVEGCVESCVESCAAKPTLIVGEEKEKPETLKVNRLFLIE